MLHHARLEYFKHFGIDELDVNGATAYIKQLKVDYQGEGFLHDVLHFNYRVAETTRAVCTFEALITKNDDNAPVAHAFETMMLLDNQTKKVVRNSAGFSSLNMEASKMGNIIATTHFSDTFKQIYQDLAYNYGCTYMSYVFEHKNHRVTHATNQEWNNLCLGENLLDRCALFRVGKRFMTRRGCFETVFRWNDIQTVSKDEHEINGIRTGFNIYNGLSFGKSYYGSKEFLGLATDKGHSDFPQLLLMNKPEMNWFLLRMRRVAFRERLMQTKTLANSNLRS